MGIPKRMAVAVSGLVFAGGAALAVGTAAPASAQIAAAAPQQLVADGGSRWWRSGHHSSRNHQRIIIINRNSNFSKSDTDRAQPDQQRQEFKNQRPRLVR
jgi:hypothetical protein